jgi:hypothetical protein
MHELLRSMEAHQNRGSSRSSKFKGLHHHLLMIAAPAILCGAGLGLGLVQESETSFKLRYVIISKTKVLLSEETANQAKCWRYHLCSIGHYCYRLPLKYSGVGISPTMDRHGGS